MNFDYLTQNGVKLVGVLLIVVAIMVIISAKKSKIGDALSTFAIVLIAAVIMGMGSVLVGFGTKIANALFG